MNRIDKTQFPFPYAQLLKVLMLFWVFTYPFVLEPTCKVLTPIAMLIIAGGFFGCEGIAEILENPFGTDANDIDLKHHAGQLITDLEIMYYGREAKVDYVFNETNDLDFEGIFNSLGYKQKGLDRILPGIPTTFTNAQPACLT